MIINIIAAVCGSERAIGRAGDMIYHLRDDLRHFKALTMGCPVIMGRKTYQSLPKRPLPGRRNVVITRDAGYAPQGVVVAHSLHEALTACKGADKVFIIGGGQIYAQAMDVADNLIITNIQSECPVNADTFFPDINPVVWHVTSDTGNRVDSATGIKYNIIEYSRGK